MNVIRREQYNVIIYGIGGTLRKSIDYINFRFNIIGFSDKDPDKANDIICKNSRYYAPEVLREVAYDYIIITSDFDDEICDFLVKELGVSRMKVLKREEWNRMIFHYTFGCKNSDKEFYVLSKPIRWNNGLLSVAFSFIEQMSYIEENNCIPIVDMKNYPNQYLEKDKIGQENAWEYYYEPMSSYSLEEVYQSKNVIMGYDNGCYLVDYEKKYDVHKFQELWKKYIKIKPDIQKLIEKEYLHILPDSKRVLGVLYRGTDMTSLKLSDHAVQPTVDDMKELMKKYLNKWNCDKIFLCTEDQKALDSFIDTFGDKIRYTNQKRFSDTGDKWLAQVRGDRENDRYLRGLEYLIAIELLAKCDNLLAGICGGSVCAIVINDGKYQNVNMVDKGVY